jgi:peptidoglycan/xylan/chitin deacetylase (PgdA/CDA1 family)
VLHDVDRGAQAIKAITGTQPRYLRPPDWIIPDDARRDLEHQGYRVLTIASENPVALRDVNSLDYLCAGKAVGCPKPSLADGVIKQVEQREKRGIYTHILAFHELSTTTAIMPRLISDLKARGYRFVTLTEYMSLVEPKRMALVK